MSTTVLEPTVGGPTSGDSTATVVRPRAAAARIPLTRIVGVELRKMFDTRAGFWLMASIVITSLLATAALIVFAPDDALTFDNFAAAIGAPMTVILPMIGILAVTSEWSQRSGLTTFTLIPHRGRVLGAKFLAALVVGIVAMFIALVVGTLGTLLGSVVTGLDPVWNATVSEFALIVVGSVLGMLFGFMLGVLIRNSAGAIVAYFVYTLVLPPLLGLLASTQQWFADLQPWVDYGFAQAPLFNGTVTSEQWQQLAVSGTLWFLIPLAVGLVIVRRSEVK
ncbi:ABC transporter permease subunit [Nostocoides sp. F2B08]|uniref:ABC transporter permease n=1 Tax=Nostocoides sp. F2B08 TaxID=2653936 RepID=UPI001263B311|nr:ABC transporter permease subunit [Tetrasphaera sp. F2B08]KAB7745455.1 ABC transporter permease subunit [Tetrasphaera sp. F2B08]